MVRGTVGRGWGGMVVAGGGMVVAGEGHGWEMLGAGLEGSWLEGWSLGWSLEVNGWITLPLAPRSQCSLRVRRPVPDPVQHG